MSHCWLTLPFSAASPHCSGVCCSMGFISISALSIESHIKTQSWKEGQAPGSSHGIKDSKKSCDFGSQRQTQMLLWRLTSWCCLQGMMDKPWSEPVGCVFEIQELWKTGCWASQGLQCLPYSHLIVAVLCIPCFTFVYFQRATMKQSQDLQISE